MSREQLESFIVQIVVLLVTSLFVISGVTFSSTPLLIDGKIPLWLWIAAGL